MLGHMLGSLLYRNTGILPPYSYLCSETVRVMFSSVSQLPQWNCLFSEPREGDPSSPPSRWAHTVSTTSQGLLIFGGFADKRYKNDAWLIDKSGKAIKIRDTDRPGETPGDPYVSLDGLSHDNDVHSTFPTVRSNAAGISIDDSVLIFGGAIARTKFNDAYLLGLIPRESGAPPLLASCRLRSSSLVKPNNFCAGCAVSSKVFVVFGGNESETDARGKSTSKDTEDLLVGVLDSLPSQWWANTSQRVTTISNLLKYPPLPMTWRVSKRPVAADVTPWPPARKCHVMVSAPVPFPTVQGASLVLMHGGCFTEKYEPLDDTWILMPLSVSCTASVGKIGERSIEQGVFSIAATAPGEELFYSWVKPACVGGKPAARWGHAASLVPERSPADACFLIVGGCGFKAGADAEASTNSEYKTSVDLSDVFIGQLSLTVSEAELSYIPPNALQQQSMKSPLLSNPPGYFVSGAKITWSKVDVGPSPSLPLQTPHPRRRLGAGVLTTTAVATTIKSTTSSAGTPASPVFVIFGGFTNGEVFYHGDAWCFSVDAALRSAHVKQSGKNAPIQKSHGLDSGSSLFPAKTALELLQVSSSSSVNRANKVSLSVSDIFHNSTSETTKMGGARVLSEGTEGLPGDSSEAKEIASLTGTILQLRVENSSLATEKSILQREVEKLKLQLGQCLSAQQSNEQVDWERQKQEEQKRLNVMRAELDDENKCKVCLDEPYSVVFLPCRHLVLCVACFDIMNEARIANGTALVCPICNTNAKTTIKIAGLVKDRRV